jgi:TonB family protein
MSTVATKAERAPGSLAAQTGRIAPLPSGTRADEDRLLMVLVGVSLVAHICVIAASGYQWLRQKPMLSDEMAMDADLVTDFTKDGPAKTVIPNSKPAPEPKATRELLPQLPKQFSIKENTKVEDAVAEEKQEVKEPEKEAKPAPVEQKADTTTTTNENKDNQVKMLEALKRRALDRIRAEQQVAKQLEAPEKDKKLAQVAENLFGDKRNRAVGSPGSRGKLKGYFGLLNKVVHQHYNLPEVYNLKAAGLEVVFEMTLNETGALLDLVEVKGSGDRVFDELTKEAIKAAAPFPAPPKELVGQPIPVRFTP